MSFGQRRHSVSLDTAAQKAEYKGKREERFDCLVKVLVRNGRFGSASGLLRDFSEHGVSGKVSATMHKGDQIEIYGKGFTSFIASIKWVQGGYFGAELIDGSALDIDQFMNLPTDDARWGHRSFKSMSSSQVFGRAATPQRSFGNSIFEKGKA